MRDPHVVDLTYRLVTDPTITYKEPPPIAFDTPVAGLLLRDGLSTVTFKEHFASASEARAAISGVLSAWELRAAITSSPGKLAFRYEHSNVVDRSPPAPGEPQTIYVEVMSTASVSDRVDLHQTAFKYPDPPGAFMRTPEVEVLSARWLAYRAGKEPLPSCAYYIATLLRSTYGSYEKAAASLSISKNVIEKLHYLYSRYGDEKTARKADASAQPLTGAHTQWIESTIPAIILRVGQLPTAQAANLLTMADFPALP